VAINSDTITVTVTIPSPIRDLTLHIPTTWNFVSSTVAVDTSQSGAVILVGVASAGTKTLVFRKTSVTSTSKPVAGPTPTTTTISIPVPTLPAPTPVPTNPIVID